MNFSELCTELTELYPTLSVVSAGSSSPILSVCRYEGTGMSSADSVLVICESEWTDAISLPICLGIICIGWQPASIHSSMGLAVLSAKANVEDIFLSAQKCFNLGAIEDDNWVDLMHKAINNADIQSIISRAGRILGNPITFGDYSSKLIARTGDVEHGSVLWEEHSKYGFFTYETLHSPNYAIMMNQLSKMTRPLLIQDGIGTYKTMNIRVKVNGALIGILCALDANRPFREKDKENFTFLASVLEYYYRKDSFYRFIRNNRRDVFYKEIIEGSLTDAALLRKRAKSLSIPTDNYCCVAVAGFADSSRHQPEQDLDANLQQMQNKLEWYLPRCQIMIHRQTIIAVITSKSAGLSWIESGELCHFLTENGLSMGVSRIVQGIEHTLQLYRQASGVRNVRIKGDRQIPIVLFEQYPFHCLFQKLPSNIDIEAYCSKPLKALIRYDQDNNTDYIDTLQTFLNHSGSATNTAKALFIHRSTLIYRLKKIEEILGLSLEDSSARQSLMVSLMILGY